MASDSEDGHDYEYDVEWDDGTTPNRSGKNSRAPSASSRASRAATSSRGTSKTAPSRKGKEPARASSFSSQDARAHQSNGTHAGPSRPATGGRDRSGSSSASRVNGQSTIPVRRATPNGRPLKNPPPLAELVGSSGARTFSQFLTHSNGEPNPEYWEAAVNSGAAFRPGANGHMPSNGGPSNSTRAATVASGWGNMRTPGGDARLPEEVPIESQGAFMAPAITSAIFLDEDNEEFAPQFRGGPLPSTAPQPASNAPVNINVAPEDIDINMAAPLLGPSGFLPMNDADRAERAGQDPDDSFALPICRHTEFEMRFFGPRNNNVLHIARKTNTHLSLPEENDDHNIYIWGTPKDIKAAKEDLSKLVRMVDTEIDLAQRRVGGWAKIRAAPSDRKQIALENQLKENRERAKFRKNPEAGQSFRFVGVFWWPAKEVNPQTVLGLGFEAFDKIRTEHKVYILYDRASSTFRILGGNRASVDIAVARIYGTFCEIASKNRRANRMILVMPPDELSVRKSVHMDKGHPFVNRQVTVKRVEGNSGIQLYLPDEVEEYPDAKFMSTWLAKKKSVDHANMQYMRRVFQQGLNDVAYYRGYAKLKIYFGQLVLFGYKRSQTDSYGLLELMDMMRESQTHGEVIRSLANPDLGCLDGTVVDQLLVSLKESSAFSPVDLNPDDDHPPEKEHEENISATFELRLYDENGRSTEIRLEVEFNRAMNSREYKPMSTRWINISDRRESRRKGPIDIKVFDIKTTVAYHMELSTWQAIPDTDIYPIFHEFVRRLRVEDLPDTESGPPPRPGDPDTRPTIRRVSFVNLPGISVATLVQKTKYRYYIHHTKYIFELTKYESLPVETVSMMFPDGIAISYRDFVEADDVRYGGAIYNEEWDSKLKEQAGLKIGEKGAWDPELDVFFASSGNHKKINGAPGEWDPQDGFGECIGRVSNMIEFIVSAQGIAAHLESEEAEADRIRLEKAAELGVQMEANWAQYMNSQSALPPIAEDNGDDLYSNGHTNGVGTEGDLL